MIHFQEMIVKNGKARRLYTSKDETEASKFANRFNGTSLQYLPDVWRIVI